MRSYPTLAELFWGHVQKSEGCWRWIGAHMRNGYGHMGSRGKTYSAHRLSYELNVGPIPNGMCVLHRCDVRDCVNPEHLWLGTKSDNTRDMDKKGRRGTSGPRPGFQRGGTNYCHGYPERAAR